MWEVAIGYFFVSLIFFFPWKAIVEIYMEFQNSFNLQRGPIFLMSCTYHLMLVWMLFFWNFDKFFWSTTNYVSNWFHIKIHVFDIHTFVGTVCTSCEFPLGGPRHV